MCEVDVQPPSILGVPAREELEEDEEDDMMGTREEDEGEVRRSDAVRKVCGG